MIFGLESGTAVNETLEQASMGIASGDYLHRIALRLRTNFTDEYDALFSQRWKGT